MNDHQSQPEALDLRSYLRPIWRRKWIVLAITVVAAVGTYLISSHKEKSYSASTRLYITDADPTLDITNPGSFGTPSIEQVANVAQLMTAGSVTRAVSRALGKPVSSVGSVNASPSANSDFVTVTGTSQNAVLAARLADEYVSAFLRSRAQAVAAEGQRKEQAAQASLATLPSNASSSGERQTLLQQLETYRQVVLNPSVGAQQIDKAVAPNSPSSPRPKRDAIFGGVVGLVLGLIAAFCIDLLDRRLVSSATVESIFNRPVLAVLPHVSDPTPLLDGVRAVVPPKFLEELRSLTVMLRLGSSSAPPRTIMVTSTLPREGKSTVTRDLALVYAEAGARVLVIDGDLRRPSMDKLFGIECERGLVHILRGEASLAEAAVVAIAPPENAGPSTNGSEGLLSWPKSNGHHANGHDPGLPGSVDVLGYGERLENPLALLSSDRMIELLEEASKAYDIVLVDTPPVLAVSDSVPLMEFVDSVLLVARLGLTTRHAANRFMDLVDRLSLTTFSGVVVNDRRDRFTDEGYGTYGQYSYRGESKRGKAKADSSGPGARTTAS